MNWLQKLLVRRRPALPEEQAAALHAWRLLPEPDGRKAMVKLRAVVLDVESSGLDVFHDRLISIGAVVVQDGLLSMRESFEVVLRQQEASRTDNILVHGIGGTAQREGMAPIDALLEFLAYTGKSPVVAFHAAFDTIMIGRALREHLGLKWKPKVIDLADLMPALFPGVKECHQLDDWLQRFAIGHYARHQALSDAFSTAQLLQVALAAAGTASFARLDSLQREQRALRRLGALR
jgi:DNA polymerase-3 subunit epsilon